MADGSSLLEISGGIITEFITPAKPPTSASGRMVPFSVNFYNAFVAVRGLMASIAAKFGLALRVSLHLLKKFYYVSDF